MPHVCLVPMSGFRIRQTELGRLGMSMPGLSDRAAAVGQLPALGLLTLAGMLPDEWTCCYRPIHQIDALSVQTLIDDRPLAVAISALTASINDAIRLSRLLRDAGIRTIIGGLHATAVPETLTDDFDAVAVGSGELIWHEILNDCQHNQLRPVYRASTAPNTCWPRPRFDLLPDRPHRFTLQTQRGCPLACEFCGASRLLGRFSEKPVTNIHEELRELRAIRRRPLLELADDNSFAGGRDHSALLECLKNSGARWFTECDWRTGEDPEIVEHLAESGCMQVLIGMESLAFQYPGMGAKRAELDRMVRAAENFQQHGVVANACFILGADGESHDSISRLVDFLESSPFAEVQLTLQTPFPGTGLYNRLRKEGRLIKGRDWSYYTLFDVTYHPDKMTVEQLESEYLQAVRHVFRPSANARRSELRDRIWRINLNRRLKA